MTILELQQIMTLARNLPVKDDALNLERLRHVANHGHILIMQRKNRIVGYAEFYRLKNIPKHPVEPLPKDDPDGKYLYCWAASCDKGYIRELIDLAKKQFPDCEWIIYHRRKKNNRLFKERIEKCLQTSY